jgi:hypothetical protein
MSEGLGCPCHRRNPTLQGPALQGGLRLADARHCTAPFPTLVNPSWVRTRFLLMICVPPAGGESTFSQLKPVQCGL